MYKALKISAVLSRVNLIVWSILCVLGLLSALASGNFLMIVACFLLGSIVLHSYAAIQLHKSIRNAAVPLSSQTPAGIRFIGYAALFFGVSYLPYGVSILRNAKELLQQLQSSSMPQFKEIKEEHLRVIGFTVIVLGLAIVVNVLLNFRLLRWYLLSKENGDNK
jgi:uncharacterized protein YjeT (DUF2065 family)